jgi:hypothetical protein
VALDQTALALAEAATVAMVRTQHLLQLLLSAVVVVVLVIKMV